jgi:hypothetical protein
VYFFQLLFHQMGSGRQDKKGDAPREPKPNLAIVCSIKPKHQAVFIRNIAAVKLLNAHNSTHPPLGKQAE